jgi:hypothetical protein
MKCFNFANFSAFLSNKYTTWNYFKTFNLNLYLERLFWQGTENGISWCFNPTVSIAVCVAFLTCASVPAVGIIDGRVQDGHNDRRRRRPEISKSHK